MEEAMKHGKRKRVSPTSSSSSSSSMWSRSHMEGIMKHDKRRRVYYQSSRRSSFIPNSNSFSSFSSSRQSVSDIDSSSSPFSPSSSDSDTDSSSSSSDSDTELVESLRRWEDLEEVLLPGIPNDIALDLIVPKLPWKDILNICRGRHVWQEALQSPLVHDARVGACSTETFYAIMICKNEEKRVSKRVNTIALYSAKDRSWHELPPIPNVCCGIRHWSMCAAVDHKVYVFGGGHRGIGNRGSSKVYVLNLVGQRSWKRCANMLRPRLRSGCGVKDGKVYVFGGISRGKAVVECEVYDPEVNAWSTVKPMKYFRFDSHVELVGEKLVVHSGGLFTDRHNLWGMSDPRAVNEMNAGLLFEMYDPTKDEWNLQLITNEIYGMDYHSFIVKGRVYMVTDYGVYRRDCDKKLWKLFQRHSWKKFGISDVFTCTVRPTENELLMSIGRNKAVCKRRTSRRQVLLQSKGFGIYGKKLVWEEVTCLPSVPNLGLTPRLMCSIQL